MKLMIDYDTENDNEVLMMIDYDNKNDDDDVDDDEGGSWTASHIIQYYAMMNTFYICPKMRHDHFNIQLQNMFLGG